MKQLLIITYLLMVPLSALAADNDPLASNFGSAGATVDTDKELGGDTKSYANSTTTAVVNCSAGSISNTSIALTSAANFDAAGGTASICDNTGKCNNFTYTSISANTFNGVANANNGALATCTGNYAAGTRVYALTTATTLAQRLNVLQDAVHKMQKVVGVNIVTPASLGVSTLNATVAALGSTNQTTLRIDQTLSYGSPSIVTSNITLEFVAAGMIDCNNTVSAVDIRGPLIAPQKQIFTNCITNPGVSFASNTVVQEVSPLWWGAVGDDSSDSTLPIQRAVDALPSSSRGGVVLIPPGTFKITGPITLKDGTTLHGAGMLVSIIKNYANSDAIYAVAFDADYIHVEGLQIYDGLGIASRSAGDAIHFDGSANAAQYDVIERVYIIGHENGISIQRGAYNSIRNTRVVSPEIDCYVLSVVSSTHTTFDTTGANACGRDAYNISDADETLFLNTFADGSARHGYYVNLGTNTTFINTTSEQNSGNGYYLLATDVATLNTVSVNKNPTIDGIRLEGARWVTINSPHVSTITGYCIRGLNSASPARNIQNITVINPQFDTCTAGTVDDPQGQISVDPNFPLGRRGESHK